MKTLTQYEIRCARVIAEFMVCNEKLPVRLKPQGPAKRKIELEAARLAACWEREGVVEMLSGWRPYTTAVAKPMTMNELVSGKAGA